MLAGFTKTGLPSSASSEAGVSPVTSALRSSTWRATGSPAAASRRLDTGLSMQTALDSTPGPT